MKSALNHIAFLVPDAVKAGEYLRQYNFKIGAAEKFDGEGTLEVYVEGANSGSGKLLLIEPIGGGVYANSMVKRGPGLHHIAIDVLNIETFIDEELSGSGWLLHPKSLKTIQESKTAWLARPGVPTLIEIQQTEEFKETSLFITKLMIPSLSEQSLKMFGSLGLNQIQKSENDDLVIVVQDIDISFREMRG